MNVSRELQEQFAKRVMEAKKFRTVLITGNLACRLFKQMYVGDLYTLKTAEDVRNFKEIYNFDSDKVLVFEDLSLMTSEVQASLLKFIEEPTRPLMVLCSKDNVSDAMRSRFMYYIKLEDPVTSKFLSTKHMANMKLILTDKENTLKRVPDSDITFTEDETLMKTDLPAACMKISPEYYHSYQYIRKNEPHLYNYDTYLQFIDWL